MFTDSYTQTACKNSWHELKKNTSFSIILHFAKCKLKQNNRYTYCRVISKMTPSRFPTIARVPETSAINNPCFFASVITNESMLQSELSLSVQDDKQLWNQWTWDCIINNLILFSLIRIHLNLCIIKS